MTSNNETPEIDLDQLTCPECGAAAKRIITWAHNPHEHGEGTGLHHSVGARDTLQVEFECDNGHVRFHTEASPRAVSG
jgi:hypothetical protein